MSTPPDNRPFLGDPSVVEKILINIAREGIGCRIAAAKGIIREEDANTIEEKEVEARARIFLSRDKAYATKPEWNKPGVIDAFLAKELSLDIRGAESVVKAALSQFLWDVREKLNLPANPDVTETIWTSEIKDIVALHRDLFMGIARSQISVSGETQVWSKPPEEKIEEVKLEFLGDPNVVEKILISLARESLNAHRAVVSNFITIQDAAVIEEKEIENRAIIFLGRDKNYAIDPNWNKPGVLDGFLAKELEITTRGAEDIIKEALAGFLVDVRQHFDVSEHPNFTEAEWKAEVQDDISRFRDMFLGLKPAPPKPTAVRAQPRLEVPPGTMAEIPTRIFEKKDLEPTPELAPEPSVPTVAPAAAVIQPEQPEAASPPAIIPSVPELITPPVAVPAPAVIPEPTPVAVQSEPPPPASSETVFITKPFLSDPQAVEKILGSFAKEVIGVRIAVAKGIIIELDANEMVATEVAKRTKIFLGRHSGYAADANWNVPGALDLFLAKQLELEASDAEEIVKSALLKYVHDLWQILDLAHHPDITEADWQPKIQPVLAHYRNIFVGLPSVLELPAPAAVPVAKAATITEPEEKITAPPPEAPAETPQPKTAPPTAPAAPQPTPKQAPAPVRAPQESRELAGVGASQTGEDKRSRKWLLLILLLLLCLIPAVVFMVSKRSPQGPPQQAQSHPQTNQSGAEAQPEKAGPKVFSMQNGKLFSTRLQNGRPGSAQEVKMKKNTATGTDGGQETQNYQFWYDISTASDPVRLLVATRRDPAFAKEYSTPNAWDMWLTDETGQEKLIYHSVLGARFSPDGTKIAYVTSGAALRVIDLEGKLLAQTDRAYDPNWSPDGRAVIYEHVLVGRQLYPPDTLQLSRFYWQANQVETVLDGRYGDTNPSYHPSGKWILFASGGRSGGASFWKVPATGGAPMQLTNLDLQQGGDFVPTPYQTSLWSATGQWFLYDFKYETYEQTWGLEFDENGNFKRALKVADGLAPQWIGPDSFVYQKRAGENFEMVTVQLPGK